MDHFEHYLTELQLLQRAGAGVDELSGYPALKTLLDAVGKTTKPKVRTIMSLRNLGAGLPDGGLFTAGQFKNRAAAEPKDPSRPDVAAIEVKGTAEDINATIASEQVNKYLVRYGQVLVTNYFRFVLMVQDRHGGARIADQFDLASDEAAFWRDIASHPRKYAQERGERFTEFLTRVLRSRARLTEPSDVAWMLASHARDAMEILGDRDLPALATIRTSFEEALGITFEGEDGDHFFRSSLVQTLFYGIFSGWVLWNRENPAEDAVFDWKDAGWTLHVPMISALFDQIATRAVLGDLQLVPVLERTGEVLNRVDRPPFFTKFREQEAVQYFYEPFLRAFDPELRKQLGVWYTPHEVVQYMVARVDTVLREELDLPLGLADPNVVVLDPCCGTGAYLVEVLKRIETTLRSEGGGALVASELRKAAQERIFGFEILPAPFVVAHLQLGLLLRQLGAPLPDKEGSRVGVFLTNALTGWNPDTKHPDLPFRELAEERDRADKVKQSQPILVILGNPPYNGYAGVTPSAEERELSDAYRTTKLAPAPQGQGLNDLYVRFFRMAERKIVEQTGKGIVCFISNYSWLDGLSFTGMRERYLEVFDKIWIDCLNGDKYKTGKLTPEGEPDPSIFSTESNREGIQIGTAVTLLVRRGDRGARGLGFRHLWGVHKRQQLASESRSNATPHYLDHRPAISLGLSYMQGSVVAGYSEWPRLTDLLEHFSPGVKTSRDLALVDVDLGRLRNRLGAYFDSSIHNERLAVITPQLMKRSARFDPIKTRGALLKCGIDSGHFVRFAYQPFDVRYLYWHPETKLLDEKRVDLFRWVQAGARMITSRQKSERQREGSPFYATVALPEWHLTRPGAVCFPDRLPTDDANQGELGFEPDGANLTQDSAKYLEALGISAAHGANPVWLHSLAIGHSPLYLRENSDALRQDWPRIPLPATREALERSAALGAALRQLLDPEVAVASAPVSGYPDQFKTLGVLTAADGDQLDPAAGDLALTAGWGHAGKGGVTMPGRGKLTEHDETVDVWLNDRAFWANVPKPVWEYTLGGYQVIKKWLSYRQRPLLGRDLTAEEAKYVSEMVRRIAAILALGPALDASYEAVKADVWEWGEG